MNGSVVPCVRTYGDIQETNTGLHRVIVSLCYSLLKVTYTWSNVGMVRGFLALLGFAYNQWVDPVRDSPENLHSCRTALHERHRETWRRYVPGVESIGTISMEENKPGIMSDEPSTEPLPTAEWATLRVRRWHRSHPWGPVVGASRALLGTGPRAADQLHERCPVLLEPGARKYIVVAVIPSPFRRRHG